MQAAVTVPTAVDEPDDVHARGVLRDLIDVALVSEPLTDAELMLVDFNEEVVLRMVINQTGLPCVVVVLDELPPRGITKEGVPIMQGATITIANSDLLRHNVIEEFRVKRYLNLFSHNRFCFLLQIYKKTRNL